MRSSRRQVTRSSRFSSSQLRRAIAETLESRLFLAANLAMEAGAVVDSGDHILASVNPGQRVYIEGDYLATDLNTSATYRLDFTVNGMTMNGSYTNQGEGVSGSHSYGFYWGQFVVSPGVNLVTITVDPDHTVAESSYTDNTTSFQFTAGSTNVGSMSYSVSQMRAAYGLNNLAAFGSQAADGTGQTIAIIDEYNDPNILNDVDGFDTHMHMTSNTSSTLYDLYGGSNSFATVYNQTGTNITANIANSGTGGVPIVDPAGNWAGEETMDVEWAHAMAPGAHIDIIETVGGSSNFGGLFVGANEATLIPNVTVVSMSWSWAEGNWASSGGSGETAMDSNTFSTPGGHTGITFIASSADGGMPSGYPSYSPNVISVGGTELTITSNGYGSETGWNFPAPTKVVTYNGSGFSKTGTWTQQSGGYSGAYATATASSGSVATWTSAITSSDRGWQNGVEVSSSWVGNASDATNAVFKIYDGTGTSGTLLGTVNANQTLSSGGTQLGVASFQDLGTFFPSADGSGNGSITVTLSTSGSNGTVSAGAIGIAPDWASGGGQSVYESEPTYQQSIQSSGKRETPDLSMDSSENSGVTCFQNNGLGQDYYGTSLAAPTWAGIMAIVDQGRVALGGSVYNTPTTGGPQQALSAIYSLPSSDFHDITNAYNGFFGGNGYDMVTGRGSPMADKIVPDLVSYHIAPAVSAGAYSAITSPSSMSVTFSEDVSSSFTASDLTLSNLTASTTISNSLLSMSRSGNTYTITYTGQAQGILPDGNYTLTVAGSGVNNLDGTTMSGNYTLSFFVLAGDANRDRFVDSSDTAIVNAHLGQAGNFSQGDFNYDGIVNSADQAILNSQLAINLPGQDSSDSIGTSSSVFSTTIEREATRALMDVTFNGDSSPDYRIYYASLTNGFSLSSSSGSDTLVIDYLNGAFLPAGVTMYYNGGGGSNTIAVVGSPAADTVTFSSTGLQINSTPINASNYQTMIFNGLGGNDNVTVNSGPAITIQGTQHFASLTLNGSSVMNDSPGHSSMIVTRALLLSSSAKLDLYDNDLLLNDPDVSRVSTVQGWINTGRAGGTWTGNGIISTSAKTNAKHTTALGAMGAFDYERIYGFNAKFDGEPIENSAVLVKYTYYGDANFSGTVDGGDYAQMDITFGKESTQGNIGGWINGDFDGDGRVTGSDYGLADLAFGAQTGPINQPPAIPPALPPAPPPTNISGGHAGLGSPRA